MPCLRVLVSLSLLFGLEAADCDVKDEVSLLQVASKTVQAEHRAMFNPLSSPVDFLSEGSMAMQMEFDLQQEMVPSKEYHCLPHFKAGTDFCKQAASFVANQSRDMGRQLPEIFVDEGAIEFALKPELMKTPKKACLMNFVRNPFDLAVSSYLYAKADLKRELYMGKPLGKTVEDDLDGCIPGFVGGRMQGWCEDKPEMYAIKLFHRAMAKIYKNSSSGPHSDVLPTAKSEETYGDYLKRIPMEAGLLAASTFVTETSLDPMKFTKDYISKSNQWCSTNVCFSDLYDNCHVMWDKVLKAWQIPENDFHPMLLSAVKACPADSEWAKMHSSASVAKNNGLDHPPLHQMVKLMREVDKKHLNGKLAALEADLGCGSSESYKEPKSEQAPTHRGHSKGLE